MEPVRLAIDVVGGDHGSEVVLRGTIEAKNQSNVAFSPRLCGNKEQIESIIKNLSSSERSIAQQFEIEHCPEIITNYDTPSRTWKAKKNSSIIRCISLQKEKSVDASISAGDTGTLLSAAVFILGCSENVERPALAAFIPTTQDRSTLLLDVGANLNCRVNQLVSFGLMGFDYYRKFFEVDTPRVFLLNIGRESFKGTRTLQETDRILKKQCIGYKGYIEGSQVLSGEADIIVCDGFSGNVLLKACESFHRLVESVLSDDEKVLGVIKKKMAILNSENYGAVPLLGIKGTVLKAHGCSSSMAIAQAILTAAVLAQREKCECS